MCRGVCALLLLSLSLAVYADTQYWVALGSYTSLSQAETGLAELEQRAVEPLSVISADVGGLPRYRVLAGPYSTPDAAAAVRLSAGGWGVAGAWIMRTEEQPLSASSSAEAPYAAMDWSSSYEDYPELDLATPPESATELEPREKKQRTLVDEAPADYQLHKLRRQ